MTLSKPQQLIGAAALGVLLLVGATLAIVRLAVGDPPPPEKRMRVEAKRVVNGHYVKTDDGGKLIYAGIRAPYENEPFYEEAKQRNAELVVGKDLRLRFEPDRFQDDKGRLWAYAFVDHVFVNETLVREGLAYVRLTTDARRFADQLLAAQAEAQRKKRGFWSVVSMDSDEESYPADPKYANFHRPSCEVVPRMNPERRIDLETKKEALAKGFAPCNKCLP